MTAMRIGEALQERGIETPIARLEMIVREFVTALLGEKLLFLYEDRGALPNR